MDPAQAPTTIAPDPVAAPAGAMPTWRLAALFGLLFLALAAGGMAWVAYLADRGARDSLAEALQDRRQEMTQGFLESNRRHARRLAELTPLRDCALGAKPPDAPEALSTLQLTRRVLDAQIVYVMKRDGTVVASSRYGAEESLTGENYSFRPYFTEAIGGREATYPAVGVKTDRRGIYFSAPIVDPRLRQPVGVLTIKAEADILAGERSAPGTAFALLLPSGVVFASNRESWILQRLPEEVVPPASSAAGAGADAVDDSRRVPPHILARAPFATRQGDRLRIAETSYQYAMIPSGLRDLRLMALRPPPPPPTARYAGVVALALLFAGLGYIGALRTLQARNNRRAFEDIFNSVTEAIFIHDPRSGAILRVNDAMLAMFGYHRGEPEGLTVADLSAPDPAYSLERAHANIQRAAAGERLRFEWLSRRRDGSTFWGQVNLRLARIGGRDCILAVERNIDEEKRLALELTESEAKLHALVQSATDHVFLLDAEGRFLTSNGRLPAGFASSARPVAGRALEAVYPEVCAAIFRAQLDHVLREGAALRFDHQCAGPDGERLFFETTLYPVRQEERLLGVGGQSRDVTAQREAERRLAEQQARYRELFTYTDNLVAMVDPEGRFLLVNPALAEVYGLPAEALRERSVFEFVDEADRERTGRAMSEWIDAHQARVHFENRVLRADGARRQIQWSVEMHYDETGAIKAVSGIGRDVTEERRLQRHILDGERKRAIGTLISGVAHQFNNALSGALGFLQMIQEEALAEGRADPRLDGVERGCRRVVEITRNLLTLVRDEATPRRELALAETVAKALTVLTPELEAAEVSLEQGLSPSVRVVGNEAEWMQVVINLVLNARDALLEASDPTIAVSVAIDGAEAVLVVEDNGCGVAPEDVERIHLPFFSRKGEHASENSPLAASRGVGLGLSIVDRVVRDHGGRMTIVSHPGAGTVVTIHLPRAETASAASDAPSGAATDTGDAGTTDPGGTAIPKPDSAALLPSLSPSPSLSEARPSDSASPANSAAPLHSTPTTDATDTPLDLSGAAVPAPRAEAGPESVAAGGARPFASDRPAVLILDDEEDIRVLVSLILKRAGYPVRATADGREALEWIAAGQVEIALVDLQMPLMDGIDFLERLEEVEAAKPVCILLTGRLDDENLRAMRGRLYWEMMLKPFEAEDLLGLLDRCVAHHGVDPA